MIQSEDPKGEIFYPEQISVQLQITNRVDGSFQFCGRSSKIELIYNTSATSSSE